MGEQVYASRFSANFLPMQIKAPGGKSPTKT